MQIKISKASLSEALNNVQVVVAAKAPLAILQKVKMTAKDGKLELTCSDLHGKTAPGDNPLGRGLRPLGEVGLGPQKGLGHEWGPGLICLVRRPHCPFPRLLCAVGRVDCLSQGRCRLWVQGRAQVRIQ